MKRTWMFSAAMAALLVCHGCGPALVAGAGAGGYYVGKDERPAKVIASDAAITSKINALLLTHSGVSVIDIDVDTYRGEVQLHGKVETADGARKAVELAQSVKGVKTVESHLRVVR